MLDDYSLRLLAEIGIDVYVPRADASGVAKDTTEPRIGAREELAPAVTAPERASPIAVATSAEFVIVCAQGRDSRLLGDLQRGLRMARLDAAISNVNELETIATARGLLILGESLVRALGADIPAQRQNEMAWIISSEPQVLAKSAEAKRSLWGEIKRLSRAQSKPHPGV